MDPVLLGDPSPFGRRAALRRLGLAGAAGLALPLLPRAASAQGELTGIASRGGWQFPQPNPVIKAGDFRSRALWNDPHVMRDGQTYLMYMTTSVNAPFKPPVLPFRFTSPDGFAWTMAPDTPLLSPDGTPFVSLETPSVVRLGATWHMFFTGIFAKPNPAPMAIGHARSSDGITWTVTPKPVLTATGLITDWNGFLVGEPGAIVRGNRILVYFSAVGARPGGKPPSAQSIGLAITTDGTTFSAPRRVLEQAPVYPPARNFVGYSTPMPFDLGGKVHLAYDVAINRPGGDPEWQQVALHHAVSPDGETGWVQDDKPLLTRDDFPWTGGEIRSPSILVEDGTVRMWFAGHGTRPQLGQMIGRGFRGGEFGIGYATRPAADLMS